MPVTFTVATHPAEQWWGTQRNTAYDILAVACGSHSNGFAHAVLNAWAGHFYLRIRPDDVWVAILNQLNFYINAHAEELRRYFVAHDGKRELKVTSTSGDFAAFARKMSLKIRENVVDSTLVEWVLPDFTTTTVHDRAVCSIVMMASLKQYFTYASGETCGIPSVTLEGEKSDWEEIYRRLGRLYELGDEPSVWAEMLRPILRRFIRAFDWRSGREMCGQDDLSGWLTAFCVWDHKGQWKPRDMPDIIPTQPTKEPASNDIGENVPSARARTGLGRFVKTLLTSKEARKRLEDKSTPHESATGSVMATVPGSYRDRQYTLDGVSYFTIPTAEVPEGYCEVDVTLYHDEHKTHCTMVAGHFAISASPMESGGKPDTLSPAPHWVIFEKKVHLE
ncbi:hypothetical protein C8T65DRAFT_834403 [Cerioporus squamosus]|nr:hypothetical protein C8T65DRAFT_834403 [Cerioporus squamosus]